MSSTEPPADAEPADLGQRLLAQIIDTLLVQVPVQVGGLLIGLDGGARASVAAAIDVAYNGLLDGRTEGQTVGKRIMDIRVVSELGRLPIGIQRGLQRSIIPAIAAAGGRSGWVVAGIAGVIGSIVVGA